MSVLPKFSHQSDEERQAEIERSLISQEAKIGGKLFGPLREGHWREFYCKDEYNWVWYEEWPSPSGQRRAVTTLYTVRPDGILKQQDGKTPEYISRNEAHNLYNAAELYRQKVGAEYQRILQAA